MKRGKNGFTLVELLVAMVILVIVFGLVTYLYTRAAKVRKIVVVNSEIQQVLSQVMDTLTYGDKAHWGIIHATGLDNSTQSETTICLTGPTGTLTAVINPSTNPGTVTVQWDSENPVVLDPAGKVEILTDATYPSRFEYYDSKGQRLNSPLSSSDIPKVSFIKIVLWARSRDPVMKFANPVPLVTGVKLRNKSSF